MIFFYQKTVENVLRDCEKWVSLQYRGKKLQISSNEHGKYLNFQEGSGKKYI